MVSNHKTKNRYWTEKEIESFVKMRKQGLTYKEISKILNRSLSSLQTMIHNIKCRVDILSSKIRNSEEEKRVFCIRCGKPFIDINYDSKFPLAKRIYCNDCVNEIGGVRE